MEINIDGVFIHSFIHSFVFYRRYILAGVTVDLEPFPGNTGCKAGENGTPVHDRAPCIHIF